MRRSADLFAIAFFSLFWFGSLMATVYYLVGCFKPCIRIGLSFGFILHKRRFLPSVDAMATDHRRNDLDAESSLLHHPKPNHPKAYLGKMCHFFVFQVVKTFVCAAFVLGTWCFLPNWIFFKWLNWFSQNFFKFFLLQGCFHWIFETFWTVFKWLCNPSPSPVTWSIFIRFSILKADFNLSFTDKLPFPPTILFRSKVGYFLILILCIVIFFKINFWFVLIAFDQVTFPFAMNFCF